MYIKDYNNYVLNNIRALCILTSKIHGLPNSVINQNFFPLHSSFPFFFFFLISVFYDWYHTSISIIDFPFAIYPFSVLSLMIIVLNVQYCTIYALFYFSLIMYVVLMSSHNGCLLFYIYYYLENVSSFRIVSPTILIYKYFFFLFLFKKINK